MLKECEKYLSNDLKVRRSDVLSAWRGWRPLAVDPHAPPGAQVSRDHVISKNPKSGVTFIAGGKWTTWREMAEDVLDKVLGDGHPKCNTLDIALHGGDGWSESLSIQLIQKYGLMENVAEVRSDYVIMHCSSRAKTDPGSFCVDLHPFSSILSKHMVDVHGKLLSSASQQANNGQGMVSLSLQTTPTLKLRYVSHAESTPAQSRTFYRVGLVWPSSTVRRQWRYCLASLTSWQKSWDGVERSRQCKLRRQKRISRITEVASRLRTTCMFAFPPW